MFKSGRFMSYPRLFNLRLSVQKKALLLILPFFIWVLRIKNNKQQITFKSIITLNTGGVICPFNKCR